MKYIKLITLLFLVTLFHNCKEEIKEEKEKVEEKLNIFNEKDIIKIKNLLNALGDSDSENSVANNNLESKPWFWEIYFNTKDTITKISSAYTRDLTSPYLTMNPSQIYGQSLKLETFNFGKKDSTKTKNYKNSLFSLDSINLNMLPNIAEKAMKLHQRKYYRKKTDSIVGIKIYIPNFSLLSKINIMVIIGDYTINNYRDAANNISDKLYYATYEYNHKGKLLFSEHKGMNRKYYDK